MPDPVITYRAIRANGVCAAGLRTRLAVLRRAGVVIPRRYSETAIPLSTILRAGGVEMALDAIGYAEVGEPWVRHFACDCAERALLRERANGHEPDPRSWRAVEVSRAYACGEASAEDLTAAWDAIGDAIRGATRANAWAAAWDTARVAAWDAARAAAWDAAWATTRDAARDAAWAVERRWQGDRLALYISDSPIPPVAFDREAR
jgi:hypothetical protein